MLQSNLSTTATLGTGKSGPRFVEVAVLGVWGVAGRGGGLIKHFKGVHYVYCGKFMLNVSV